MNRLVRAVAGGTAGMAVMMIVLLFAEAQTRFALDLPIIIAHYMRMPDHQYIGFALFLAAGILAWPVLFAGIEDYLRSLPGGEDVAVRGVVFALALWVAFLVLGGVQTGGPLLILYLGFTLLAHVAYGWTLGIVYARLAE